LLGGRLEHDADAPEDRPIFTHPNSTLTQLEFMVPTEFIFDPRLHASYRATWWHDTHPLRIRKQSHFTLATQDLDHARRMYVDVIGGTVLHEGENDLLKTRSVFVAVGYDDVVELAEPLESGTPIADYVAEQHNGLFSVAPVSLNKNTTDRYQTPKDETGSDMATFVSDPATTRGSTALHHRRHPGDAPGLVSGALVVQRASSVPTTSACNQGARTFADAQRGRPVSLAP
jgi:hypothetical protein